MSSRWPSDVPWDVCCSPTFFPSSCLRRWLWITPLAAALASEWVRPLRGSWEGPTATSPSCNGLCPCGPGSRGSTSWLWTAFSPGGSAAQRPRLLGPLVGAVQRRRGSWGDPASTAALALAASPAVRTQCGPGAGPPAPVRAPQARLPGCPLPGRAAPPPGGVRAAARPSARRGLEDSPLSVRRRRRVEQSAGSERRKVMPHGERRGALAARAPVPAPRGQQTVGTALSQCSGTTASAGQRKRRVGTRPADLVQLLSAAPPGPPTPSS